MVVRTSAILLLAALLSSSIVLPATVLGATVSPAPAEISITVGPATLPADGGTYSAIYVSLTNSVKAPTLASGNVSISLSSSNPTVGSILNSTLSLQAGDEYKVASFQTSLSAGTTQITASATGLTAASVSLMTAVPRGFPTSIALSAVPAMINSTSQGTGVFVLELQDEAGLPAEAVGLTTVSLFSSSTDILTVGQTSVQIHAGKFLGRATFSTSPVPGTATVTASSVGLSSGSTQVTVLGSAPLGLKLYAQPATMPACVLPVNTATACFGRLTIALVDANGNPTVAAHDTTVFIRSSDLNYVSIPESGCPTGYTCGDRVVIPAGSISTTAAFETTSSSCAGIPGECPVITVSSPGLRSDFATIQTTPPASAVGLQIYVGPSTVLANDNSYSSIVVSLVGGKPNYPAAVSATDFTVVLTSSRSDVGNITSVFLTIPSGQNYATAVFKSTYQVGQSVLTASSHNLLPDQATISTYGAVPSKVVVEPLFPTILADGESHQALQVNLEDAYGTPALAGSAGVLVFLESSRTDIGAINGQLLVPPGQSSAIVNMTTTAVSGTTTILARVATLGTKYNVSSTVVSTVTPSPSSLGVSIAPSGFILTPKGENATLIAQLQDSAGGIARARSATKVTVTSSNAAVFGKTLEAVIPQGDTYVDVPIRFLGTGQTTFTVTSPGLASADVAAGVSPTTYLAQISASALSVSMDSSSVVTLRVVLDSAGVSGTKVTWTASGGTLSASSSTLGVSGDASVIFTPAAPGLANITAHFDSPAIGSHKLSSYIQITPATTKSSDFLTQFLTFPFLLIPVGAVAIVVVLAVLLVRRRRRRGAEADESLSENGETDLI
jgi:hypothetical protein